MQTSHLEIVHNFLYAREKLMMCLLIKKTIFTLQCLCTTWLNMNIVMIIHTRQEVWSDEVSNNNAYMTIDNSQSFRYKVVLVGKTGYVNPNSFVKNTKLVVPLKYLSKFWRSLEMPLINCKIHFELNWIETAFHLVLEALQNLR